VRRERSAGRQGCSPARTGAARGRSDYTLVQTARLNDIDPQAWLVDVLARINGHPARDLDALLPWNWRSPASDHEIADAA
jgi:transposase